MAAASDADRDGWIDGLTPAERDDYERGAPGWWSLSPPTQHEKYDSNELPF